MFFSKRLKKLKMCRMYMPSDKCRRLRKTRLLKSELNTVPSASLCAMLTELKPKGD